MYNNPDDAAAVVLRVFTAAGRGWSCQEVWIDERGARVSRDRWCRVSVEAHQRFDCWVEL